MNTKQTVTHLLEFAGASSYLAFRHATLQKIVSGQPLTTFLTLELSFWIGKDGRMRRAMMDQEKVCQYNDCNNITHSPHWHALACLYEIYKQTTQEMDMYTHLLQWKAFLEAVIERRLSPEDYLFPHIGVNGVIRTDRQMSYDCLQGMLTDFCEWSGIQKRYTTHSFRRGGAQYRFMYAPIGKRWSLNRIRWWGGWAVGEHVRYSKYSDQF